MEQITTIISPDNIEYQKYLGDLTTFLKNKSKYESIKDNAILKGKELPSNLKDILYKIDTEGNMIRVTNKETIKIIKPVYLDVLQEINFLKEDLKKIKNNLIKYRDEILSGSQDQNITDQFYNSKKEYIKKNTELNHLISYFNEINNISTLKKDISELEIEKDKYEENLRLIYNEMKTKNIKSSEWKDLALQYLSLEKGSLRNNLKEINIRLSELTRNISIEELENGKYQLFIEPKKYIDFKILEIPQIDKKLEKIKKNDKETEIISQKDKKEISKSCVKVGNRCKPHEGAMDESCELSDKNRCIIKKEDKKEIEIENIIEIDKPEISEKNTIYFNSKIKDYNFLSNFSNNSFKSIIYSFPEDSEIYEWPTLEHYYQTAKFSTDDEKNIDYIKEILSQKTPASAKKKGAVRKPKNGARIRDDFEKETEKYLDGKKLKVKDLIMIEGIKHKFNQNEDIKNKLLDTYPNILIEKSPNDSYWGNGKGGKGLNMLGKLLMNYRDQLLKGGKDSTKPEEKKSITIVIEDSDSSEKKDTPNSMIVENSDISEEKNDDILIGKQEILTENKSKIDDEGKQKIMNELFGSSSDNSVGGSILKFKNTKKKNIKWNNYDSLGNELNDPSYDLSNDMEMIDMNSLENISYMNDEGDLDLEEISVNEKGSKMNEISLDQINLSEIDINNLNKEENNNFKVNNSEIKLININTDKKNTNYFSDIKIDENTKTHSEMNLNKKSKNDNNIKNIQIKL